jgi:hypothetical protein
MTDTRLRALSAALEYWRQVEPTSWDYPAGMMSGGAKNKNGGAYAPEAVIQVAEKFAAFLDGCKVEKKPRGK